MASFWVCCSGFGQSQDLLSCKISRKWTHHITTFLFSGFGLWSLWDSFKEGGVSEELAKVEAELVGSVLKTNDRSKKTTLRLKMSRKRTIPLSHFSEGFLLKEADYVQLVSSFCRLFLLTSLGDENQLAIIRLAADENPLGVVLGGIVAQTLCTTAAVIGGKSLASQISERIVTLSGGMLFIICGNQSFLTPVDA